MVLQFLYHTHECVLCYLTQYVSHLLYIDERDELLSYHMEIFKVDPWCVAVTNELLMRMKYISSSRDSIHHLSRIFTITQGLPFQCAIVTDLYLQQSINTPDSVSHWGVSSQPLTITDNSNVCGWLIANEYTVRLLYLFCYVIISYWVFDLIIY